MTRCRHDLDPATCAICAGTWEPARETGEPGRPPTFTAEEDEIILVRPGTDAEIADLLGRTVEAVRARRDRLTHRAERNAEARRRNLESARTAEHAGEGWSREEDEIVLDPRHSTAEAARLIGRTESAVTNRRAVLRGTRRAD